MAITFRPTWWATVAVIAGVAVLIALGSWQIDRRAWKQQIIDSRAERTTAPPVPFAELMAEPDNRLEAAEYRPIRLRGQYRPGDTLKLLSRTRDGRAGFHVIAPFVADEAERAILIDRGWVPAGREAAVTPAPTGPVEVAGFVRLFETPGRFTPDNDPVAGAWFYLDRRQMSSALRLEVAEVAPFYVQAAPSAGPAGRCPAGGVPNVALRNSHLQYAVTWYALAAVLLVIYVVFHTRRNAGGDG